MTTFLPRVIQSTGSAARGRSVGATFLSVFGALWLWWGALNAPHPDGRLAWLIVAVAACLVIAAMRLGRAARRLPTPPAQPEVGRAFLYVNVVQWIAIGLALFALVQSGAVNWAPAAIAAIVGLHFYPLGYLFRARVQYATGTMLIAVAIAFNQRYEPVFVLTGLILWATALFQLVQGYRLVQRSSLEQG